MLEKNELLSCSNFGLNHLPTALSFVYQTDRSWKNGTWLRVVFAHYSGKHLSPFYIRIEAKIPLLHVLPIFFNGIWEPQLASKLLMGPSKLDFFYNIREGTWCTDNVKKLALDCRVTPLCNAEPSNGHSWNIHPFCFGTPCTRYWTPCWVPILFFFSKE